MTETGERSPNKFQNIHFTSATWASDTKERQKRCLKHIFDRRTHVRISYHSGEMGCEMVIFHMCKARQKFPQSQLAHMGPRGVAGSQRCSLWPLLIAESSMFKDHHTSTPNALPHDNFKVGYHIPSHSPSHSTHMHLHMTMLRVTLITSHPRRKNIIHWGHCNLTRQSLVRLLQIVHLSWVFIPSSDPFQTNGSKPSGPIPVPKNELKH